MEEKIQWFKIGNSKSKRRVSLSDRTAGLMDGGEVLLPARVFGGELHNSLAMSFDGIPIRLLDGRLFCPASWLKQEFPEVADDIDVIVQKVARHASNS